MRNLLLAAAATIAIASPAAARDGSMYAGIDAGVMFPRSNNVFGSIDFIDPLRSDFPATSFASVRYKVGYDVDLNAGYDFGMFRLEGELGYKHAKVKSTSLANNVFTNALNSGSGNAFTTHRRFRLRDNASIFSGMVNGMSISAGTTAPAVMSVAASGYANVKQFGGSKGGLGWQLLAGVYTPVGNNIDIGLKYRFFRGPSVGGSKAFDFTPGAVTCGTLPCSGGTAFFDTEGHWQSHSLMLI